MDPNNPSVLYAGFWQAGRTPWMLSSGGKGSGLFKTTDGGDHWTEITRNPGLPAGIWGNIGITVSGANSNRLWANIEADSGGVFRSDDAGHTWQMVNNDRNLRQRAWYYTKIHADPKDTNVVYDNNVSFMKSDRRRQDVPRRARHAPRRLARPLDRSEEPQSHDRIRRRRREVTVDGGKTWSDEDFATAQFYHVVATTHFPYHICGAQQDNSTLCGPSRGSLDISDWLEAGGGESGWIAPRNDDPDVVYAGSYGNLLTRKDLRTGITVNVNPWPDNPDGPSGEDLKYRFQWTFPIIVSKHNSNVVYAGSNVVHKTTNGGQQLDSHLARSHVSRSGDARQLRRSDHEGSDVGRVLRDGLHHRGIAAHAEDALDRLRRRQGLSHARWRREVDGRHAEGHGEVHARLEHRRVEVRRVHRLRRGEPLSARR